MKYKKLLFALGIFFSLSQLSAQITITRADLDSAGDAIVISVNTGLSGFHPDSTGPNYTWDYSKLIPDSQRVVKFVSPGSTAYLAFTFLVPGSFGERNFTPDQFPFSLLGSPPSNVYNFYKKTNASYNIVGEGLTVSGAAIPRTYIAQDRVYKLPMNYLQKDSSNSVFDLPLPGFGYYAKKQKRVNVVDGWGTLITPYGTFNTLRIKSTLTIVDSIYLDTLGTGFSIPRPLVYEYKWLANGKKIPLLEVDATAAGFGNTITVNRVNWQDSALVPMTVNFKDQNTCPIVNEGFIKANINGGRYPLTFSWNTGQTKDSIGSLAPGIYNVTVTDRYGRVLQASDSVSVLPDSVCAMTINFTVKNTCPMSKNGSISDTVSRGRNPLKYLWSTGDTTSSINNLSPGTYTLTVTDRSGRTVQGAATIEGFFQDLSCLNIPTAFTPDGDGVNDVWKIRSLSDFPNCKVEIFNQWGSLIFKSTGYNTPWDGRYNGEPVSAGAYYYVISLDGGGDKYTGTVTIIK